MKKIIFLILTILIIGGSAMTIVSFFMPWANISTSAMGVTKKVTDFAAKMPFGDSIVKKVNNIRGFVKNLGADVTVDTKVSGYNVPILVNNKKSKVALSLAQIIFKSTEGLSWKSYGVYLLPVLGIVCAVLALLGFKNKISITLMTIISAAAGGTGLYNLKSVDISNEMVQITIENGLWYTVYAFLFIAAIGLLWLALDTLLD